MYSKDEVKQLKIDFWGKLDNEMEKMKSPHGNKVNWMNYNTGFRNIYFRMEADEIGVRLCIDLQIGDTDIREIFYEQFLEFEDKLKGMFKENIHWYKDFEHSNGKIISRIAIEKEGVSIFNRKDWDKMHLFLKLNFKKLDEFWDEFGDVFKGLK